jgi:methyl acetate hydrolase
VRLSRRDTMYLAGSVAVASAIPAVFCPAIAVPLRINDINAVLKARVDAGDVPGVVAMAATRDSMIYQGAFGVRAKAAPAEMSIGTIFSVASMTKLLTSIAAMQLVERGKLALDEPAARIDPTLNAPQVLDGFDGQGNPQLRLSQKPITLRHLLTHTSGFSYQLWDANVLRYGAAARGHPALPHTPLMFDPGTRWAYGGSLDRVGRLVEIASGQTLDLFFATTSPDHSVCRTLVTPSRTRNAPGRPACMCASRTGRWSRSLW